MNTTAESRQLWKKIFVLLPQRQKLGFFIILLILAVSAALSQITPLAIGYLTDHVLAEQNIAFASVIPILLGILAVNVVNEVIKVIRRLIVEDTAAQAEKIARRKATDALLLASRGIITIGTVLTAYLCFTQLTAPPAGAAPHSGRVLRMHRAGSGLFPYSGAAPGLFLPPGGGAALPHRRQ